MGASLQASDRLRKSREELDVSKLLSAIAIHSPETSSWQAERSQTFKWLAVDGVSFFLSSTKALHWPMTFYYFWDRSLWLYRENMRKGICTRLWFKAFTTFKRYQRSLTVCSILQTRDLQSEMPELWTSPRTLVQRPMTCLFLCNRCTTCHTYIDLPGNANSTFNFGRNLTTKRWRQCGFGIPALVKIENLELELFLCLFHRRGRISFKRRCTKTSTWSKSTN